MSLKPVPSHRLPETPSALLAAAAESCVGRLSKNSASRIPPLGEADSVGLGRGLGILIFDKCLREFSSPSKLRETPYCNTAPLNSEHLGGSFN